jgi:hypothetical protein
MVTVLITSFLLIAAISYALYWWQRPASRGDADHGLAPPPPSGGLFGDAEAKELSAASASLKMSGVTSDERAALRERALRSDKAALSEAHASGDAALYDEILNVLVEQADSDQKLLALVSYVTRHDSWRVNKRLAAAFIESWKSAPDRGSTAKMLHIAALADDAHLYQRAIETALRFWQQGRLPDLSAEELRMLVESEYWLLSSGVRSSGAGFILKLKLAGLRRQLAAAMTRIQ